MLLTKDSGVKNGPSTPGGCLEGVSLLLVEDDDLIRRSLLDWLDSVLPDPRLVGAPSQEIATLASLEAPQVIVADVAPIGDDGLDTIRRLKRAFPDVQIVALVMEGDSQARDATVAAGASVCLPIWRVHEDLVPTLRRLVAS